MTRDSISYGLLGHPLYGPLASADTTSLVLAWKPKPSTLRIAGFFPSSHIYYTQFADFFGDFTKQVYRHGQTDGNEINTMLWSMMRMKLPVGVNHA